MFYFQNYSCYITLLCCCSKLTVIAPAVASAHTSPSVPIISSSSSSIIRHLEWSWKLAFHPGVMGNTRPSTPGSRYAPYALRAPHTLAAGWPCLLPLVATARAVTLRFTPLAGLRYARRAPLRGPRYVLRTRAALDVRGSPPPSLRSSPLGDYTYGLLLVMGFAAVV